MDNSEERKVSQSSEDGSDDGEFYVIDETGEVVMEPVLDEAGADEPPTTTVESEVDRLREENEELRASSLRVRADFDNFRKRMEREKGDYFRYALSGIISDLLPVLDNFERAIESAGDREDDFIEGVVMIYRQFSGELEKAGLTSVDEQGVAFDPNVHEAVATEVRDDLPDHTVTGVLQKGFFLNGRLVRPALVKVAVAGTEMVSAVEEPSNDQESEPEE